MSQQDYIGKIVAVRTAQGELVAFGQCVSYTDRPTISVNGVDGKQTHWIADLCEVIELKGDLVETISNIASRNFFQETK